MSAAEIVCKSALNWIIKEIISNSNENSQFVIGIGSGSTIVSFVQLITDFIASNYSNNSRSFVCIPTSEQARHLLLHHLKKTKSFILGTLDEYETVNVTVDGADSVYFSDHFLIKGGGAAHCQEKIVAEASENYVIVVADEKKIERPVEQVAIPVEVLPLALNSVIRLLRKEFKEGLIAYETRNCPIGGGKIGPIVTDNGNLIIDLKFKRDLFAVPKDLDSRIRQYAGIVETGIFWRLPAKSVIIYPGNDGIEQRIF